MGGPYRIMGRIGAGGMAEVYLAKAIGAAGFEKDVAVKCILPAFTSDARLTALLIEEARIATRLNHANIVQVLDLGQAGDRYFIVMEYVEGSDLESILRHARQQEVVLPMELAVFVTRQVLQGLVFVHERSDESGEALGLVHRDVSPPNILLSRAGEVKLADFGIAKARNRAIVTEAGMIRGKASYMSPEQARGDELDRRSDLFSLGIVLHELLTGLPLFPGDSILEVMERVRDPEIPEPRRDDQVVPEELVAVVMRALATRSEERFQSGREFLGALEGVAQAAGLRASVSDLEAWLEEAMPPPCLESPTLPGDTLFFESATTPPGAGTQPLALPGGIATAQTRDHVPAAAHRRSGPVALGWRLALAGLLGGILAVILVLVWPHSEASGPSRPGTSPAPAPTFAPSGTTEEPDAGQTSGEADAARVPDQPPVPSPADATLARPPARTRGEGTLFLNSEPWARIIVDDQDTGFTTPTVDGIRLRAGRHKITLSNPELELTTTFHITVKRNEEIKRFIDLRKEGIQH